MYHADSKVSALTPDEPPIQKVDPSDVIHKIEVLSLQSQTISDLGNVALQESSNPAPEGWRTISSLSSEWNASSVRLRSLSDNYRETKPDWFSNYAVVDSTGRIARASLEHISPELINELTTAYGFGVEVPEGWMTNSAASHYIGRSDSTIRKFVEPYKETHPHLFREFRTPKGTVTTHYSPELIELLRNEYSRVPLPDGWVTISDACTLLEVDYSVISRMATEHVKDRPEWGGTFSPNGVKVQAFAPELVEIFANELSQYLQPPEGWLTLTFVADALDSDWSTIKSLADKYGALHPEWIGMYRRKGIRPAVYIAPELVETIRRERTQYEERPEGWANKTQLATLLERPKQTIGALADKYRQEYPEWFRMFRFRGKISEYFSPELIAILENELSQRVAAPEGWESAGKLADSIGGPHTSVVRVANQYRERHPEWFHLFENQRRQYYEYYAPELVAIIRHAVKEKFGAAPEDWIPINHLAGMTEKSISRVHRAVDTLRAEYFEHVYTYLYEADGRSRSVEYVSPDLAAAVLELVKSGSDNERLELENELELILESMDMEEERSPSELRSLISLFGAELSLDILYRRHPKYRKLPLPYVKSKLADYLGGFMSVNPVFSLDALEQGVAFLDNAVFKDSLTEVIKNDCLRLLNKLSRTDSDIDYQSELVAYIAYIREKSANFTTEELEEVLIDVQAYYELLFEDIHKPGQFVDLLYEGRMFPDINQCINVQEIAFKHKILIADEMGTGKSASSIMAKEILGVKQALIVVPSNVIPVWQGYLSDEVDKAGKQTGYFKEGQTPRVLVIESLEDIQRAQTEPFDYIVISQERLTNQYTDELDTLDFDMLIVDEAHKLKNISHGKRSQNLIRLAEHIDGDNKYLALLSGTPVPNKIGDVAMTLKLLYPERFAETDNKQLVRQIINGDLLDIRSLLVPRMQMKPLAENIAMPELHERYHATKLSQEEKEIYELLIDEDELTASEKMALLRQFSLNPRMLDATPDIVGAKSTQVGEELADTFNEHDKVVMFVNGYIEGVIRGDTTIIPDLALSSDVTVRTIDGSTSKQERLEIQHELRYGTDKILLLVSGQTADIGVDFSSADSIYHFNEPWSLYDKRQQTSRVYRPGLTHDVESHTFVVEGTIEQGIHEYIDAKYRAVEKVLRGVPITDIEKGMLKQAERTFDSDTEVHPELAKYYLSSQNMMAKIFGYVKEAGEENFRRFLEKNDKNYAESYANQVGSRSYQANVARLSGNVIEEMIKERDLDINNSVTIVDFASGPEMLRRHIADNLKASVISLDLNEEHFNDAEGRTLVGSFIHSQIESSSVDYLNLSLALHYTALVPSKGNFERVEAFQEINRVLKDGGRATLSLPYSLNVELGDIFNNAMQSLGLKVVDAYTGQASYGKHFRTQFITVEKVRELDSVSDPIKELSKSEVQALKLKKTEVSISDSRKMVTDVTLGNRKFTLQFNTKDREVYEEERSLIANMERLKATYETVEAIPRDEVIRQGFSRIFNGKRYILFKKLVSDMCSVAIR